MNVDDDDADGPLDPRIEMELENLNNATDDINQLEIELDEARRTFAQLQSDLKNQFIEEQNKVGVANIEKAKAYYEAVAARNEAQIKCRREAEAFRKASENLATAIETESVAMQSFKMHQHKFNDSWQEWLNQVTAQVMEDTNKKIACQREHQEITAHYNAAEKLVKELGEKYKKALIKTKRFYEIKERIDQELPLQKEKIRCLEKSIQRAKTIYAQSLRALEEISNQIHQQRRDYDIIANGPREPGVGAELVTPEEDAKELGDINANREDVQKHISDDDNKETEKDLKDVRDLRLSIDNFGGRAVDGSETPSNQWEVELLAGIEKLTNSPQSNVGCIEASSSIDKCQKSSQLPQQGWHSLTQSPINSIISKSKVALKNSFSRTFVNNKSSFSSGKHKAGDADSDHEMQRDQYLIQNDQRSHSLDSTPIHKEQLASVLCSDSQLGKTKAAELPLLSMFSNSEALKTTKDKSYSMINLEDKTNLKLVNKTVLNNIQTVSVERLADARCKLIGDSS